MENKIERLIIRGSYSYGTIQERVERMIDQYTTLDDAYLCAVAGDLLARWRNLDKTNPRYQIREEDK